MSCFSGILTLLTTFLPQLVKRNVMENVVPTVIAAKHLFESERNPLLKDLLLYLKELMQVRGKGGGALLRGRGSFS